jgi:hypothetical protein
MHQQTPAKDMGVSCKNWAAVSKTSQWTYPQWRRVELGLQEGHLLVALFDEALSCSLNWIGLVLPALQSCCGFSLSCGFGLSCKPGLFHSLLMLFPFSPLLRVRRGPAAFLCQGSVLQRVVGIRGSDHWARCWLLSAGANLFRIAVNIYWHTLICILQALGTHYQAATSGARRR